MNPVEPSDRADAVMNPLLLDLAVVRLSCRIRIYQRHDLRRGRDLVQPLLRDRPLTNADETCVRVGIRPPRNRGGEVLLPLDDDHPPRPRRGILKRGHDSCISKDQPMRSGRTARLRLTLFRIHGPKLDAMGNAVLVVHRKEDLVQTHRIPLLSLRRLKPEPLGRLGAARKEEEGRVAAHDTHALERVAVFLRGPIPRDRQPQHLRDLLLREPRDRWRRGVRIPRQTGAIHGGRDLEAVQVGRLGPDLDLAPNVLPRRHRRLACLAPEVGASARHIGHERLDVALGALPLLGAAWVGEGDGLDDFRGH